MKKKKYKVRVITRSVQNTSPKASHGIGQDGLFDEKSESYQYHIGVFLFSTSSIVQGNLHFTDEQYNDAYSEANKVMEKKQKEIIDGK